MLTSVRERSAFPTEHPLHAAPPSYWVSPEMKDAIRNADVILSLNWVDLNGLLQQVTRSTAEIASRIVHVSLDSTLHNGWSMDHFGLPPVDQPVLAGPDAFVGQLLPALRERRTASRNGTAQAVILLPRPRTATARQARSSRATSRSRSRKARGTRKFTLAHVNIGWSGSAYHFRDPLDFLGHDGGGGLAAGPGITVGAALALKDSGRPVVSVLGDGDFLQGATALWTAATTVFPRFSSLRTTGPTSTTRFIRRPSPKFAARPVENRWIGMRIDDPAVDIAALARAQGVDSRVRKNSA